MDFKALFLGMILGFALGMAILSIRHVNEIHDIHTRHNNQMILLEVKMTKEHNEYLAKLLKDIKK